MNQFQNDKAKGNEGVTQEFTPGTETTNEDRSFVRYISNELSTNPRWQTPDGVRTAINYFRNSLEREIIDYPADQEDYFVAYLKGDGEGAIPSLYEAVRSGDFSDPEVREEIMAEIDELKSRAIEIQRASGTHEVDNTEAPENILETIKDMSQNVEETTEEEPPVKDRQELFDQNFVDWATGKQNFEDSFDRFNDKELFLDEMEDIWEHAHSSDTSTLQSIRESFDALIDSVERIQSMREEWEESIEAIGDLSHSFAENKSKTVTVESLFRVLELEEEEKQAIIDHARNQ